MAQLTRAALRAFLASQHRLALAGLATETEGPEKLARAEIVEKGVGERLRRSHIGACHREDLAVISLDVRGSAKLAAAHKRKHVFIAFHCLLPMAGFLIRQNDGEVVGLRGDGVLGVVGFGEKHVDPMVKAAYELGMILIEATTEVLNPFLLEKEVPIRFVVGVGVDSGQVTLTKIGFQSDFEVTAYGEAVNIAAKNSRGVNALWLSPRTRKYVEYPTNSEHVSPGHQRIPDVLSK